MRALLRVVVGLARVFALGALAADLIEPQLLGLGIGHGVGVPAPRVFSPAWRLPIAFSSSPGGTEISLELRRSLGEIAGLGAVATDLEVHPWPFCELLAAIAPYRDEEPAPDLGLALTTSDRNTRLREGDPLTLDIFLPPDARYLYLGYVQHDGRVGYITMMPVREWAEDTGAIRFDTGFQISEPFGREMILAVTSRRPLFDQPRPAYEPADSYIAALRQRLAELRASDPDAPPAASHLFITTEPNPAS